MWKKTQLLLAKVWNLKWAGWNLQKPATSEDLNSHLLFFFIQKKLNEEDSFHLLMQSIAEQNFYLVFHQGNLIFLHCRVKYNLFFPDVAETQRLHMEQMCWDSHFTGKVPLVQNAHWIVKLCAHYLSPTYWTDTELIWKGFSVFHRRDCLFVHRHFSQLICLQYRFWIAQHPLAYHTSLKVWYHIFR